MVLPAYPFCCSFFGKLLDRHFCFYNWGPSTFFFSFERVRPSRHAQDVMVISQTSYFAFPIFLTFICLKMCIFSCNKCSGKWIKIIDRIFFKLHSWKIWGWHICLDRNTSRNVWCYFCTDIPVYWRIIIFFTILLLRNIKLVFCFTLNELLMIACTNFRIKNEDFLETIVIYHANRS